MPYNFAADSFHTQKLCSRRRPKEMTFIWESVIFRVHIAGQRANRYIVAFHITISRYRTIFIGSVQQQAASRPQVRRTVECAVLYAGDVWRVTPQATLHVRTECRPTCGRRDIARSMNALVIVWSNHKWTGTGPGTSVIWIWLNRTKAGTRYRYACALDCCLITFWR